ncbi:hypothetical protein FB157_1499 [Streptomyces sp. BK340]|nr:hypothetical protein FB157_1499 [Streptomyces sp. BK340]
MAPCAYELALPVLEELTALAIDHIGVANDLWSYHKEIQEPGAIPTLLPHVLMVERDISLPEAVTATANLCDDLIRAFENKAGTIEPTAPVQVQVQVQVLRYLDVLRAWVRGNLE